MSAFVNAFKTGAAKRIAASISTKKIQSPPIISHNTMERLKREAAAAALPAPTVPIIQTPPIIPIYPPTATPPIAPIALPVPPPATPAIKKYLIYGGAGVAGLTLLYLLLRKR